MKKKILSLLIAYIMITPITSVFAGTWVNKGTDYKNGTRWKYMNDDGSYIKNGWQLIDGEWYHFSQGAMEYDEKIYIEENNGRHKYGAPVYFVGSDGKKASILPFSKASIALISSSLLFLSASAASAAFLNSSCSFSHSLAFDSSLKILPHSSQTYFVNISPL